MDRVNLSKKCATGSTCGKYIPLSACQQHHHSVVATLGLQTTPASEEVSCLRNNPEAHRLEECRRTGVPWKKWGPYLSERQWGTVREDYSRDGNALELDFTHDHNRHGPVRLSLGRGRGLAGISDDQQLLCFALALGNGRDPILKERLFGSHQQRRQSRGGMLSEYYFLILRQHADPLIHEIPVGASTPSRPSPMSTWFRRTGGRTTAHRLRI